MIKDCSIHSSLYREHVKPIDPSEDTCNGKLTYLGRSVRPDVQGDVYHCRGCMIRLYITDESCGFLSFQCPEDAPGFILSESEIPNVQTGFNRLVNDLGDRTRSKGLRMAMDHVYDELCRQESIWGDQNNSLEVWSLVLGEELGEVNKAILEWRNTYLNPLPITNTNESGETYGASARLAHVLVELSHVASTSIQTMAHIENMHLRDQAVRPAIVPEPIDVPPVVDKFLGLAVAKMQNLNETLSSIIETGKQDGPNESETRKE